MIKLRLFRILFILLVFGTNNVLQVETDMSHNDTHVKLAEEYEEFMKCFHNGEACLIVCDQNNSGVYVYNVKKPKKPIWSLIFANSPDVETDQIKKFRAISEAKFVYMNYIAFTTSGGIVALIDVQKKHIFNIFDIKGNLHSVDLAPDGTMFAVSSNENFLAALPAANSCKSMANRSEKFEGKQLYVPFPHAVVWDFKRNLLWVGGNRTIQTYLYNWNNRDPQMLRKNEFFVEDDQVHDMFPIPETDFLWVSTLHNVYVLNVETGKIYLLFQIDDVKSLSTLPGFNSKIFKSLQFAIEEIIDSRFVQNVYEQGGIKKWSWLNGKKPALDNFYSIPGMREFINQTAIVIPTEPDINWWTNQVQLLLDHSSILTLSNDAQIYKARWLRPNGFSYQIEYPKIF